MKPQLPDACPECKHVHKEFLYDSIAENVYCARCGEPLYNGGFPYKAPYQPGDVLYVRETWSEWTGGYLYKVWPEGIAQPGAFPRERWHPSIHMPKKAARIWLKVTDVRVERLQEITDEQAEREGCYDYTSTANGFCHIWDSTLKKTDLGRYGWDANPWVWVIEFEKCEDPEKIKRWEEKRK